MALRRLISVVCLAAGGAALALVLLEPREQDSSPTPELTAAAGATFSMSNSKDGQAILSATNIEPGDSMNGTVTIANTGTIPGDFMLSQSDLIDVPGPGGGPLSGALDLLVEDVTAHPTPVYAGKLGAMGARPLGVFAGGESRTYRFTVTFPEGGPADNALMGAGVNVSYRWTATGEDVAPADTRAPRFRLGGKKRQHLLPRARRRAGLVVVVSCDEAAALRVRVELRVKRAPRGRKLPTLRFERSTKRLTAGKRTKVTLTLTRRSARVARRLLRGKTGKKGIKATVVATATDTSGNRTTKRMRVLLLR